MKLSDALEVIGDHGLDILDTQGSGIEAVAIGSKDGKPLAQATDFSILAFVPKKLSKRELSQNNIRSFDTVFANSTGSPSQDPFDIDVVESGGAFTINSNFSVPRNQRGLYGGKPATIDTQKWFSSLRCGIGCTNPVNSYPSSLSVGTIGFYLEDNQKNTYLVSNNHVIGGSNSATINDSIIQPGTLDLTGNELNQMPTLNSLIAQLEIAKLTSTVKFKFSSSNNTPHNQVDAAIAKLTDSGRNKTELARLSFGGSILGEAAPLAEGPNPEQITGSTNVYKVGRTTGYTEGIVTAIAATAKINYPTGKVHFTDQIVITPTLDNVGPFSDRGDSGSGVLNEHHELVGLLFAGSPKNTLVNPIHHVMDQLRTVSNIPSLRVITA
ncbi:hypothetical protein [Acanthopleuribacter pedis]|uniref:Uncharacterized protein n=1 Tax=Acanthopleuribacter pedis TaxID=442870 RepID=A0A8J7QB99_9BACT|nr:hypothetical protein [Acanthopleuribacter pedis]MBO1317726.1 hypothetical protein [Acanthopleuribacter pedis]